jgi:hypothetical protein
MFSIAETILLVLHLFKKTIVLGVNVKSGIKKICNTLAGVVTVKAGRHPYSPGRVLGGAAQQVAAGGARVHVRVSLDLRDSATIYCTFDSCFISWYGI